MFKSFLDNFLVADDDAEDLPEEVRVDLQGFFAASKMRHDPFGDGFDGARIDLV